MSDVIELHPNRGITDDGCDVCFHFVPGPITHRICGARGQFCSTVRVSLNGAPCPHWRPRSPRPPAPRPDKRSQWRRVATILWPTILGLMITLIMIFLFVPDRLPAADDECRDVLKHPDDWGQACDHPSHRIDVQSDLVVCRCPERP